MLCEPTAGISALPRMTTIPGIPIGAWVDMRRTSIIHGKNLNEDKTQGIRSRVHGHRSTPSTEHSICLECGVGGNLRVLEIDEHTVMSYMSIEIL